ncbi:MAG TPA: hypothetical protein VE129_20310 [Thermoanaerobaculia bacterium]|nr:hypothetical protein [Thermoanaerobaculia bacterium]
MSIASLVNAIIEVAVEVVEEVADAVHGDNSSGQPSTDSFPGLAEESRRRRSAGMDSLQRFLDILRSMNPSLDESSPGDPGEGATAATAEDARAVAVTLAASAMTLLDFLVVHYLVAGDGRGAQLASATLGDLAATLSSPHSTTRNARLQQLFLEEIERTSRITLDLARRRPRIHLKFPISRGLLPNLSRRGVHPISAVGSILRQRGGGRPWTRTVGFGLDRLSRAIARTSRAH